MALRGGFAITTGPNTFHDTQRIESVAAADAILQLVAYAGQTGAALEVIDDDGQVVASIDYDGDGVVWKLLTTPGHANPPAIYPEAGNLINFLNEAGNAYSVVRTGRIELQASDVPIRWVPAGSQQTTVGAAGGADALPASPTKYLKVQDSAGALLVIPAFASS